MGCGASAKKYEPGDYLEKYFKVIEAEAAKQQEEFSKNPAKAMEMMMDPQKAEAHVKQQQEVMSAKCTPLIDKSFDLHDTNKSEVLETDESMIFFKNYCEAKQKSDKALAAVQQKAAMEASMKALKQMGGDMAKMMKKQMEEQRKQQADQINKMIDELMAEYKADEENRNKAAFQVLDSSGDGKLQKVEVITALVPGSEKNKELMNALGLGEEVMMRKMMGQMNELMQRMEQEMAEEEE